MCFRRFVAARFWWPAPPASQLPIRLFLANSLLVAAGLLDASPLTADVITAVGGQEGVTTDQFDVSQGTIVVANSPMQAGGGTEGPSTPESALGGTDTFVEPMHAIFADAPPELGYDFIEFKTVTPILLSSYNLYLENDGSTLNRGASSFALLGGTTAGNVTTVIDSGTLNGDYVDAYGSSEIMITNSAQLVLQSMQYFEIQVVPANPDSGPRLVELDGFGQLTPEPSTFVLGVLGIAGLLVVRRLVVCAR